MYMYVRYSDSCAISSECGYFLQFEKFPLGWVGWAEGQQKEDKSSLKDFPRLKNALIKVVWQWDSVWLREGTLKWSCPQVAPSNHLIERPWGLSGLFKRAAVWVTYVPWSNPTKPDLVELFLQCVTCLYFLSILYKTGPSVTLTVGGSNFN